MKNLLTIFVILLLSSFSILGVNAEVESTESNLGEEVVENIEADLGTEEEIQVADENITSNEEVFSIKEVETVSFTEVKLIFNSNLEDSIDASREFRVVNREDSLDEIEIISTRLDENDKKILYVTFDKEALPNGEYELTVLDLRDENGRNIEFGIEGIAFFVMPSEFEEVVDVELNTATEEPLVVEENNNTGEENIDLNVAAPETKNEAVTGTDMKKEEVVANAESESKKVDKLPKTGPEYILLLILSIVLGASVFLFKFKKS